MTAILKQVDVDDFESLYPLLATFNSSVLTRESWQRLFVNHWQLKDNFCGYALFHNDEAVGYLGCILSERTINGRLEKFCNLTSWIVKHAYRNQSLQLLFPFLKMQTHTITSFTASKEVFTIYEKLGFISTEDAIIRLHALPPTLGGLKSFTILTEPDKIDQFLTAQERKIMQHHAPFACVHVMIKNNEGYCYLILTLRKHQYAKVLFVSHCGFFEQCIAKVRYHLCKVLKTKGIEIDKRYLDQTKLLFSSTKKLKRPRLFKSNTLKAQDIDYLYSELAVLACGC